MAELPKACPVILLAVQASILLVVLVGQGGPALAAPAAGDEDPLVTLSPSSPRGAASAQPPHGSLGKLLPLFPTLLQGHRIHVATVPGVAAGGSRGASAGWQCGDRQRHWGGQGKGHGAGTDMGREMPVLHGHASLITDTQRDVPGSSQTCQPGHRLTEGHATQVTDTGTCQLGHR